MSSYTYGFNLVQHRASALFSEVALCRMDIGRHAASEEEDLRTAAGIAAQHLRYAEEQLLCGLKSLRRVKERPRAIFKDDYPCFLERCHGMADALGISSDKIADALIRQAELALCHAEEALKFAHEEYAKCGKVLLFVDHEAFRAERARLVAEYLPGPRPESNPFTESLDEFVRESDRVRA